MKTIYRISIAAVLTVLLGACHGDLDISQKGGITTNDAWQSSSDAKAAMYGMLSTFRAAFATDYMYWGEYRTGLWGKGIESQPARDNVYNNTISATHGQADWTSLYTTINQCNLILKYTPTLSFASETERSLILGNALFARAFCYYWIARIWGDAPLLLDGFESDKQENLYPVRTPAASVFGQVETDLIAAEGHLKDQGSNPANIATLAAVNTLRTDLCLWLYKVAKDDSALAGARTACDAVLGTKSLLTSYADIFNVSNKLNAEVIFAWSMVKDEKEGGFQSDWLVPIQYVTDKYIENPVKIGSHQQWAFIVDDYKTLLSGVASDARKAATYDTFYDAEKKTTHQWINKYAGTWENSVRTFNSDIIVYRYADVLLFDAEIKNAQGHADDAVTALNIVAKRAYGVDDYYPKGLPKEKVDEHILTERMKEFCGEGKLWWDYIRMGVVFDKVPSLSGRESSKNVLLWPVSQTSLNDNPNIQQTEFDE